MLKDIFCELCAGISWRIRNAQLFVDVDGKTDTIRLSKRLSKEIRENMTPIEKEFVAYVDINPYENERGYLHVGSNLKYSNPLWVDKKGRYCFKGGASALLASVYNLGGSKERLRAKPMVFTKEEGLVKLLNLF